MKIQYELEKEAEILIKDDVANTKYWNDCKEYLEKGKKVCFTLLWYSNILIIIFLLGLFG